MGNKKDYEILGIPETATSDEIKEAYKEASRRMILERWPNERRQATRDAFHALYSDVVKQERGYGRPTGSVVIERHVEIHYSRRETIIVGTPPNVDRNVEDIVVEEEKPRRLKSGDE